MKRTVFLTLLLLSSVGGLGAMGAPTAARVLSNLRGSINRVIHRALLAAPESRNAPVAYRKASVILGRIQGVSPEGMTPRQQMTLTQLGLMMRGLTTLLEAEGLAAAKKA